LGLFAANLTAFMGLYVFCHSVSNDLPAASVQGLGIVSTIAASLYVTMMAFYYAKILASGVELENEAKLHLATAAQLREATSSAERAGAAKSEFLAKMSHELRTPLNAVIGYSEMLLEDAAADGDADAAADLQKIHGAGHHLLKLINQVLDLSKIEAGKMELFTEPFDVSATIQDLIASCRDLTDRNCNQVTSELDPNLGTMMGDQKKLRQVLAQILDNAAKFTHEGMITVTARRESRNSRENIIVAVQDTGIGIAPEIMPTLFENFSVGEDLTSSKYGGTGLGLALSDKLCRLMGGDISVESSPGAGTCITVRLPVVPDTSAVTPDDNAQHDGPDLPVHLPQAA